MKNAWQGGVLATLYQWWLGANYAFALMSSGKDEMSHIQIDMGLATLQRISGVRNLLAKYILDWALLAVYKMETVPDEPPPPHQIALAYIRLTRAYIGVGEKIEATEALDRVYQQLPAMHANASSYNQQHLASVLVHIGQLCESIGGMYAYNANTLYVEAAMIAKVQGAPHLQRRALRLLGKRLLRTERFRTKR